MTSPLAQRIGQGFQQLRAGRLAEAAVVRDELLADHPDHAEVLYFAAEVHFAQGELASALQTIERAVQAVPGQWQLLLRQAEILRAQRRRADAREVAAAALPLAGKNPQALWSFGKLFAQSDDIVRARACYEQALAASPRHPQLLSDLADAQFFTGDFSAAERNLDILLELMPQNGYALYRRSTLRRQTPDANHVADLQTRLTRGFTHSDQRAACLFALAKELEDLGRYDESFSALAEANTLKRKSVRYDASAELSAIDSIREVYTAAALQDGPPGCDEEGAIFIVGLPRSGTTLVERMLGSHSEVRSAGELLDFSQLFAVAARHAAEQHPDESLAQASLKVDFAELGRDYLFGLRQAVPGSHLVIDKWPANFLYCGMIRKALPRARIIHLVRDPMDSCYAVYKTLFNQAYLFSFEQDELADYYIAYQRLMQHWHAVMPGAILDVRYEDLVADPEREARRILDYCGLDWQPAVLTPDENDAPATTASAAQVREPIYTSSVQKWRRYEAGLAPLRERLQAAGLISAD